MTASADPISDPVATVIDLVAAADPALDKAEIRRIVQRVGGGRAKRRRLATALVSDPAVLTTGCSPAPKVVGELLLALRAARVVEPRVGEQRAGLLARSFAAPDGQISRQGMDGTQRCWVHARPHRSARARSVAVRHL